MTIFLSSFCLAVLFRELIFRDLFEIVVVQLFSILECRVPTIRFSSSDRPVLPLVFHRFLVG